MAGVGGPALHEHERAPGVALAAEGEPDHSVYPSVAHLLLVGLAFNEHHAPALELER